MEAFASLLGTTPDAEVAQRAGTTTSAVSQYRRYRKIPAFTKGLEAAPPARPARAATASTGLGEHAATTPLVAFVAVLQQGDEREEYVVLGMDLADAARRAVAAARGTLVVSVKRFLDVLG